MSPLPENERRILTLLSRFGPLSKKELSERGNMAWATVVKMVNRQSASGVIVSSGFGEKKTILYDVSASNPVAIGIDIEYSAMRMILTNLKDQVLAEKLVRTPSFTSQRSFETFLSATIRGFMAESVTEEMHLAGIGIGIPSWIVKTDAADVFSILSEKLSVEFGINTVVDNNTRVYTLYEERKAFASRDFLMIPIRNGIGAGISLNGQLFRGSTGHAGELSHITVENGGKTCRCGKRGCLETCVNQHELYTRYLNEVLGDEVADGLSGNTPVNVEEAEIAAGLADLFERVRRGEERAVSIIRYAADCLAQGVAALLLILNVPSIHIAGHFGPAGSVLVPYLRERLDRYISPSTPAEIIYEPLEDLGFALGASQLILKEFCEYSVTETAVEQGTVPSV